MQLYFVPVLIFRIFWIFALEFFINPKMTHTVNMMEIFFHERYRNAVGFVNHATLFCTNSSILYLNQLYFVSVLLFWIFWVFASRFLLTLTMTPTVYMGELFSHENVQVYIVMFVL